MVGFTDKARVGRAHCLPAGVVGDVSSADGFGGNLAPEADSGTVIARSRKRHARTAYAAPPFAGCGVTLPAVG